MKKMLERLRKERSEAWDRASIFARHCDQLEKLLETLAGCPCCSSAASTGLAKAVQKFQKEWFQYSEAKSAS